MNKKAILIIGSILALLAVIGGLAYSYKTVQNNKEVRPFLVNELEKLLVRYEKMSTELKKADYKEKLVIRAQARVYEHITAFRAAKNGANDSLVLPSLTTAKSAIEAWESSTTEDEAVVAKLVRDFPAKIH